MKRDNRPNPACELELLSSPLIKLTGPAWLRLVLTSGCELELLSPPLINKQGQPSWG